MAKKDWKQTINQNGVREWIKDLPSGNQYRLSVVPFATKTFSFKKKDYTKPKEETSFNLEYYFTTPKKREVYTRKTIFDKRYTDGHKKALKDAIKFMLKN